MFSGSNPEGKLPQGVAKTFLAPALKKAATKPEKPGAYSFSLEAVLHAERIIKYAKLWKKKF